MPPKDREPSPKKRMAPSTERGWENVDIEAFTLEPKEAKRQRVTGADPSKSGAQAGPSTHIRRARTGHSCVITQRGGTTKKCMVERELEAKLLISEGCIRQDVDEVLDLLHSRNETVVAHASHIAAGIAGQLDSLVLNNNEKGVKNILSWIAPPSPPEAETTTTTTKNKAKKKPEVAVFTSERAMYPYIIAFINFVAKKVQGSFPTANRRSRNSSSPPSLIPPRLIYACKNTDVKPKDSDGGTRIDIGLVEVSPDGTLANVAKSPSYYELFAVIEAKRSVSGEDEAFEQLLLYTRQLYALQHDRRFAWGVVVCGSHVRVCLLGLNEPVFASTVMDVATGPGRKAFVEFLVNCSFCDIDQLGLDPTMTYLKHIKCWKIECPTEDGEDGPSYVYSDEVIVAADRLFGRHTRCFLGSLDMPAEGSELRHDVVVKDSWSHATNKRCDEVKSLRKIRDALSVKGDIDFEYPRLLHGGCVKLWTGTTDGNGKPVLIADDTDYLYRGLPITTTTGNDGGNDDGSGGPAPIWPSREHRRIVMQPVGEPLWLVKSVPELIIVLRDAMRCHSAILNECSILHRDISTNNILVVRPESGLVRGMLIDFDCAVDTEGSEGEARTEITGTHPFMSVLNLEDSSVKRTALDDWESLLYVICWLGTYGINKHTRRKEDDSELKYLKIRRWRYGSFDEIASDKRAYLDNEWIFRIAILASFNPNMEHWTMLTGLAWELRATLIDREGEPDCKGSLERPKQSGPLADPSFYSIGDEDLVDPFEQRAKHYERISAELLGVLEKYAKEAKELITPQQEEQQ
ncbi:hypothetical protein EV182_000891 [Spiromyces aspiralis]|uniref:Uncharacterized protein n=1 Tax=Spiromyces aspiralis TaxID=68401 RepID=A0ACC1HGE8_9FUNG|nr:hypothetical protein EV182_000891 [Spiromyces aspiralis]